MNKEDDLNRLAQQFLDLWEDQVLALTTEAKTVETVERMLTRGMPLMSSFARKMAGHWPPPQDSRDAHAPAPSAQSSGHKPTSGAAPPAPACDDESGHMAEFERRLADVERRLVRLEKSRSQRSGHRSQKSD